MKLVQRPEVRISFLWDPRKFFHGWRNYGSFKFSLHSMNFTGSPTIRFPYPLTIAIILLHLPSFTSENKAASQSVRSTSVFEAFLRLIVNLVTCPPAPAFVKRSKEDHMSSLSFNGYFERYSDVYLLCRRRDGFTTFEMSTSFSQKYTAYDT